MMFTGCMDWYAGPSGELEPHGIRPGRLIRRVKTSSPRACSDQEFSFPCDFNKSYSATQIYCIEEV